MANGSRFVGQAAIESCSGTTAGSLKAQAAMEYLVTYGWALLVLFVVLAYLLTSGAFTSTSFSSQECAFQPDLPCSSFILYRSGDTTVLQFALTNGLGFPIKAHSINFTVANLGSPGRQTYPGEYLNDQLVATGQKINFTQSFAGTAQPLPRDFRTLDVSFTYLNCRAIPCTGPYTVSGRISAIVEGQ